MLELTLHAKAQQQRANAHLLKPKTSHIKLSKKHIEWLRSGTTRIEIAQIAVDFYLLSYLRTAVTNRAPGISGFDPCTHQQCRIVSSPPVIDWIATVDNFWSKFTQEVDEFVFVYLCAACAGEIRHFKNHSTWEVFTPFKPFLNQWKIVPLPGMSNSAARFAVQNRFLAELILGSAEEFLVGAERIFQSPGWGSGFGGHKWKLIAQAGLERIRNNMDTVTFIDRVFDLKHNNGPMFDKNPCIIQGAIKYFLNDKATISTDSEWLEHVCKASPNVRYLAKKAKDLGLWQVGNTHGFSAPYSMDQLILVTKKGQKILVDDDEDSADEDSSDEDSSDEDSSDNEDPSCPPDCECPVCKPTPPKVHKVTFNTPTLTPCQHNEV